MKLERGSGILLHISSLPSAFGIGDLGPEAHTFVERLANAKQKYWQILPLNPTDSIYGNSPYLSVSAFALNPLLFSPEALLRDGLLKKSELASPPPFPQDAVDFEAVKAFKMELFERAFGRWQKEDEDFAQFHREQAFWLDDYALFMALREHYRGKSWNDWPKTLRDRQPAALDKKQRELDRQIRFVRFQQYILDKQWRALKDYCRQMGVQIIGDLPIYIEYGSADVWCSPQFFKLDAQKRPYVVAGVPPDYFSATGQRWGNPIYDWEKLQADDFRWWAARLSRNLKLFDIVRIDHFRGLIAYWQIPAAEKTAVKGEWVKAPTEAFMAALQRACPQFNVIAEDLGLITDDIKQALADYGLPGMKVLQFAFGENLQTNAYLPHNYPENCIVYTGTHDNNTTLGWYRRDATDTDRWHLGVYFNKEINEQNVVWNLIELALSSRADVAVIPAQDILELDEYARMNVPGTHSGNWKWRLAQDQLTDEDLARLAELTLAARRA